MTAIPREVRTVAVVGAGLMWRGIAQVAAQAGFDVMLYDMRPGAAMEAKGAVSATLSMLAGKGKLPEADASRAAARIAPAAELGGVAGADLVVEAIVERLDAKQALFRSLEDIVGEQCILATNTSSLSITAIAAACKRPERAAGLHFFSPVPLMKLVEVIGGLLTAAAVVERLMAFGAALGHTPVRARDTPGFIVNHVGRGFGTEALRILGEGIADVATIDRVLTQGAGFRMGPFALFDLTGLDVSQPVMESIYHQFYEEPRFRPSPLAAQRLAAGVLGRKTGHGFYDYADGAAVVPPPPTIAAPRARKLWVSARDRAAHDRTVALIRDLGAEVDPARRPAPEAICIVLPRGRDATTAALDETLDPRRTVALDVFTDLARHRTLMTTPVTDPTVRDAVAALFAADGGGVAMIHDSPGFIVQRVLAHIVNIACDMAQQRIASPSDIDLAVRLGLAYPQGPLAWGDALGPQHLLGILSELSQAYGDPRYRPSPWLSRRARLGVSLLTPEA
ncbi:MAG: 3-hydroxyacyl-CoA dehydrogenase [Casimicrobiaceae bacterium]